MAETSLQTPEEPRTSADIITRIERIDRTQEQILAELKRKKDTKFSYGEDENKERGNWSGKFDFVISTIGFAVGLGNVWRFPYLCYKNGGGAFLIPYVIFLFAVGIPIFCAELAMGQFSSQGPVTMWQFAPIFKGVGIGMCCVSFLVAIYYNVIISWAFYYLFASFQSVLPWASCGSWSSAFCEQKLKPVTLANCSGPSSSLIAYNNGTCFNRTSGALYGIYNETVAATFGIKKLTPANDYLNNVGLQVAKSTGLTDLGPLRWDMSLCLLLAWILVFLCLSKGIKSSGKVVYFTALFPYVILIILLVNGLTQDGYMDGINFYMTPNITRLQDGTVWKDAAFQIFFSLGVCWGGLSTMASYNRFHTNVVRDTFLISIANCATSIFAGFVIFSYLGSFAKARGATVKDVVDSGVGLAFIVYPQAVTTLPVPVLWSILFFFMLILLGLDTQFALLETVTTGIVDSFVKLRPYKTLVILVVSIICFFLGLVMCTPGGPYVLTLMDDYCSGWNLMVMVILECLAIAIYGFHRFTRDIETMAGSKVFGCIPWRVFRWYFIICWGFLTPSLLLFIMIFSWIKYTGSSYGSYVFPAWANGIGWMLTCLVLVAVFATMIVYVCLTPGGCKKKYKLLCRPTTTWGPALVKHRQLITYVDGFLVDPNAVSSLDINYQPYFKPQDNPMYQPDFTSPNQ